MNPAFLLSSFYFAFLRFTKPPEDWRRANGNGCPEDGLGLLAS
jgi:hypothetical protein